METTAGHAFFDPSPQLAHFSDSWIEWQYPALGPLMHGIFCLLIGIFSTLFVIHIYHSLLRYRIRRFSWTFSVVTCASLLVLILLCLIEVLGSRTYLLTDFNFQLCNAQSCLDTGESCDFGYSDYCDTTGPGADDIPWLTHSLLSFQLILPLLSDGMIVRRTQTLVRHRMVSILLGLSWVATLGAAASVVIIYSQPTYRAEVEMLPNQGGIGTASYIFLVLSAACNFTATSSVAVMLWSHRRYLTQELGVKHAKFTRPQRILILLVESGGLYCVLQAVYIFMLTIGGLCYMSSLGRTPFPEARFPGWRYGAVSYIFQQLFTIVSGLYPVMISVILNIQIISSESRNLSVLTAFENVQDLVTDHRS